MICSKCRHVNPADSLICQQCKSPLTTAPVIDSANDSPFGDFLPTWFNAAPAQPAAPRQTGPLPGPAPARPGTGPLPATGPLDPISIDALLKKAAPPAWSAPAPGVVQATPVAPKPDDKVTSLVADPTYGLPVPDFAEPPLWHKLPAAPAWAEVSTSTRRETPSASRAAGTGPDTRQHEQAADHGPEYGVERGFYFFTDDVGEINLHALAGLWPRLVGAVADAIITAILGVIFFYAISMIIVNRNLFSSITGIYLAGIILPTLTGFLYHTLLVGMGGQTLGHRWQGIKVIRRGGRAVGIVSGTVRALYGIVPSILVSLVGYFALPQTTIAGALVIVGIDLLIYALAAFGLVWCLFDRHHQGLHDKLADTYVVSANRS